MRNPRPAWFLSSLPLRHAGAVGTARLLAAWLLLGLGCAHPTANAPRQETATLVIRNLGDFAWAVALEAAAGNNATNSTAWEIPPRGERTVVVPAGEYRLRQRIAGTETEPAAEPRKDNGQVAGDIVRLLGGRSYTWPLATLLSESEEAAP